MISLELASRIDELCCEGFVFVWPNTALSGHKPGRARPAVHGLMVALLALNDCSIIELLNADSTCARAAAVFDSQRSQSAG